jgi:hypothetical protein
MHRRFQNIYPAKARRRKDLILPQSGPVGFLLPGRQIKGDRQIKGGQIKGDIVLYRNPVNPVILSEICEISAISGKNIFSRGGRGFFCGHREQR